MILKKTTLLAIILFPTILLSQWTPVTSPFSGSLYSIERVSDKTAFIGGSYKLLKTTDGGNTWSVHYDFLGSTAVSISLVNDMHFVDTNNGYIVSNAGKLAKTTDQGTTWTDLTSNTAYNFALHSIDFSTPNTGVLVGIYGIASRTQSGGALWSSKSLSTTNDLYDVKFYPGTYTNVGLAVGESGTIRRTVTSGNGWFTLSSGVSHELRGIWMIDQDIAYIVGHSGTILRSSDRGQTWSSITSGTTNNLNKIHFQDALTGYIVGDNGTILKSIDGGLTWQSESSGVTSDLNDITYFNNNFYAVGYLGVILKKQSITSIEEKERVKMTVSPNPNNGIIILQFEKVIKISSLFITDINGRLIKEITPQNVSQYEISFEGASGIYFLNVVSENERRTLKLIKE